MKRWSMILAVLACLALLGAGATLAEETSRTVKVASFADDDEKQLKVEVVEEDGKSHVKVWEIVDGQEKLIKEYDADDDDEHVLDIDGKHMIFIKDDGDKECRVKIFDGKAMFDGDHEDVYFMSSGDDDMTWFSQGGAYLGVQLSDLSEDQAAYFEVKSGEGALITEVVEDSPAAAAGFQIYDIIVEVDGEKIDDANAVVQRVGDREEDDEVEVVVRRKGKQKTLKATLAEREGGNFALAMDDLPHGTWDRLNRFEHKLPNKLLREHWTPFVHPDDNELENLRADIEELRAQLEELRAERK